MAVGPEPGVPLGLGAVVAVEAVLDVPVDVAEPTGAVVREVFGGLVVAREVFGELVEGRPPGGGWVVGAG